jgi:cytochrome P450
VTVALHKANTYAESLVRLPLWLPTPSNLRFAAAKRVLDGIVHAIIEKRRRSDEIHDDVLGTLMAATDETGSKHMDDGQLRDEVMTLFLAGHETIANSMSWALLLLHQHPDVAARVRDEVENVLGGRAPTFDDLPRLTYLGQVIYESMRLYPPAWIVEREALDDDQLGPWRIRKGTIVAVSPFIMHRSPALWNDPDRFDPDRFAPDRIDERSKHAYFPFGAGPRVCIGNHFALMEAKLILSMVLSRYAVDRDDPGVVTPVARVTLRPSDGMPARLRRLT